MFVKYFVCVTLFHSHKIHRKILILMHFCFKDSHLKGLNISKKTCFSAIILNRICYRLERLEGWFQNAAISKGEKHYFLVKNIEPETKKNLINLRSTGRKHQRNLSNFARGNDEIILIITVNMSWWLTLDLKLWSLFNSDYVIVFYMKSCLKRMMLKLVGNYCCMNLNFIFDFYMNKALFRTYLFWTFWRWWESEK